jgi:hypothetical protein
MNSSWRPHCYWRQRMDRAMSGEDYHAAFEVTAALLPIARPFAVSKGRDCGTQFFTAKMTIATSQCQQSVTVTPARADYMHSRESGLHPSAVHFLKEMLNSPSGVCCPERPCLAWSRQPSLFASSRAKDRCSLRASDPKGSRHAVRRSRRAIVSGVRPLAQIRRSAPALEAQNRRV